MEDVVLVVWLFRIKQRQKLRSVLVSDLKRMSEMARDCWWRDERMAACPGSNHDRR